MNIKKLREDAIIPTIANRGDVGLDLYIPDNITIYGNELKKIALGFALEIPYGYVGLVLDRSSISTKYKLKTMGGVIDPSYRGEMFINLINLGVARDFERGTKLAQLVLLKVIVPELQVVQELSETNRGEKGYGSSDIKKTASLAVMCEHANEVPMNCPCNSNCYCKTHTCAIHYRIPGGSITSPCGVVGTRYVYSEREVTCEGCRAKIYD